MKIVLLSYLLTIFLDHDYAKNHYVLIAVVSSRQRELDADPKAIQQIEFVGELKNWMVMVMLQMRIMINRCLSDKFKKKSKKQD